MTKEQYIAQYWGQKVFSKTANGTTWVVDSQRMGSITLYSCLTLRSIDMITDDEAIETSQIGFNFFKECFPSAGHKLKVIRERSKITVAAVSDDEKTCLAKIEVNNVSKLNYWQIMHLISIGINLSTEAITNGWCILKEVGVPGMGLYTERYQ